MRDNVEIEIKFSLERDDELILWLNTNADYIGSVYQEDIYFQPKNSPFIKEKDNIKDADEWLRVRTSGKEYEICYKRWYRDVDIGSSLYANELETEVKDKEVLIRILEQLGYEQISVVKKKRDSWLYKNFKIEKDFLEDLGTFYEVELTGKVSSEESGEETILGFLRSIGISNLQTVDRGYSWMQWNSYKPDTSKG